ncbi:MAG: ABC transporter permease [Prevotellaceae bacterium]|nr:ABC transporter permease [Prevotella sp.]MDD7258487.1 ABC transporter permease [Prevotellaceae bacterium]
MKQIFNLKSYFTFLSRNKVYTAINMFGLSVSFAFAILIGLYYQHETGIDKDIDHVEQLYLVGCDFDSEKMSGTSREIIRLLQKQLPQIETGCAFHINSEQHVATGNGENVKTTMMYTDSTFYAMFNQPLVEGDATTALNGLTDVVISRRLAQTLFIKGNAMGKVLTLENRKVYVKGIFEDMSGTSFPECDIIGRYELLRERIPWLFDIAGNFGTPDVVLKLKKGTQTASLEKNINGILQSIYKEAFQMDVSFQLIPFSGTYFSSYDSLVCQRGKPDLVYLIFAVGIIILVFSVMNYINLTVALSGNRSKEMATRRLLGSQKSHILWRLVIESVCICCCSVVLSILLAWAFVPYTCKLLDTHFTIAELFSPLNLLMLVGIVLTVGVLAGVLPAVIQSRVKPIDVVRGTFRRQTKMLFSKIFIVVQNVITIIFIAVTLIGSRQIRHLIDAPLGYDTKSVMGIGVPRDARKANLFKKALQQLTSVKQVSVGLCSPLSGGFNQMAYIGKKAVRCQRFYVDKDYLPLLGIKVQTRYAQSDSVNLFVSPNFHSAMQLKPNERTFRYNENDEITPIHGILSNFHLYTIDIEGVENQVTVVYQFDQVMSNDFCGNVLIKVEGNEEDAFKQVQDVYKQVYHEDLVQDSPYLSQKIAEVYKEQTRIIHIVTIFAFLAILISLLGLVSMSTYFIQQRNKEIAVRKVFGSTSNQMRTRLIRTFLNYVTIAFVISVPVVWYFISEWISQYSYRIVWWPWIPVAGIIVWLISFAAVVVQSYVASNENPVKHIKDNQ